jgi:dTDP-4-dehydrorhamnose 3,5-epimerase
MHRLQADRYFICSGSLRVVLYDGREDSPTHKQLAHYTFADRVNGLVYIPPGVWHADQNIGEEDAIAINFPTRPHDRSDPDKYRIDPHSGEIPFDWTLRDG